MADVLTSEDIRSMGESSGEIRVSPGAIITDVARETAEQLGVRIVPADAAATGETAARPAGEERPVQDKRQPRQVLDLNDPDAGIETDAAPPSRAGDVANVVPSSPFSPGEMRLLRAEFPSLSASCHLANCSQGAQSRTVRRAVEQYMTNWLDSGMDWDYWVEEVGKAKNEFAGLINAEPEEVAVVSSVSEAISSVASALDYEGDKNRILLTEAEFPTVGHVWLAHEKYGAEVDFVPLTDGEIPLQEYERMMDERTALASITHVYYQTGYQQDLNAVADVIHRQGGLVLVDAYQSAGTCEIDVKELDIDLLTTGNLKYLLGVPGIAFIYVRSDLVSDLHPAETGWFAQHNPFAFQVKDLDYAHTARRLEGGTPPVTAAFAAQAGMQLLRDVGLNRIEKHIDYLSGYCMQSALDRGLSVASPLDVAKKGATTAIEVPGDSHEVEMELKRRGVVTSARGNVIRIAPHYFNTDEDIDLALDELTRVLRR